MLKYWVKGREDKGMHKNVQVVRVRLPVRPAEHARVRGGPEAELPA